MNIRTKGMEIGRYFFFVPDFVTLRLCDFFRRGKN